MHKTKVTLDTRDCFFILQGNQAGSINELRDATEYLSSLIRQYLGGEEQGLKIIG